MATAQADEATWALPVQCESGTVPDEGSNGGWQNEMTTEACALALRCPI